MKKIKTPCFHWELNLENRSCNHCGKVVVLEIDKIKTAEMEKDAHNARVLGDSRNGYTSEESKAEDR